MAFDPNAPFEPAVSSSGFDPNAPFERAPTAGGRQAKPKHLLLEDKPGVTYGTVLPFAKDETTGDVSWAWPELIRAPVRGAQQSLPRPFENITPDQQALVGLLAPMVGGVRAVGTGAPVPASAPSPTAGLPAIERKAVERIAKQAQTDARASGQSPAEMRQAVEAGRTLGVPLALSDVGGRNVQKLSGVLARQPGAPGVIADASLTGRLEGSGSRLTKSVEDHIIGGPTMRQSAETLKTEAKTNAGPLYRKLFEPGSVAPLEKQFEEAFTESSGRLNEAKTTLSDANRQMLQATAAEARAGENVYLSGSALSDKRAAQAALDQAQQSVAEAEAAHAANLGRLRQAQEAVANGERGGVWSPRVQQFLDDPIIKQGIPRGIEIQRLEALAEGRPMNLRDYAVNEAGEVIATPNMRLLDSAKRGLDAILEDYRDETTHRLNLDERGRAIDAVRQAYVSELDRINPEYAPARAAWSGPAQSAGALRMGRSILSTHPEDVQKIYGGLAESDQKFFKMGAAEALKDTIAKGSVTAPEIRGLAKGSFDSMIKERIRPLFSDEAGYNRFLDAVTGERKILESRTRYRGGSQTAERETDALDHAGHAMQAARHVLTGDLAGTIRSAIEARRMLGIRKNAAVDEAMAKLLYDAGIDLNKGPGQALMQLLDAPAATTPPSLGARP